MSPALVSNVEAGRRRASNNYLKTIRGPLKHDEWHLREIREKLYAEILLSAVLERCVVVAQEAGEIDASPEALALLAEAQSLGERVDESRHVILASLAALGADTVDDFDPVVARKGAATHEDRGTALRQTVKRRFPLSPHLAGTSPHPVMTNPGASATTYSTNSSARWKCCRPDSFTGPRVRGRTPSCPPIHLTETANLPRSPRRSTECAHPAPVPSLRVVSREAQGCWRARPHRHREDSPSNVFLTNSRRT